MQNKKHPSWKEDMTMRQKLEMNDFIDRLGGGGLDSVVHRPRDKMPRRLRCRSSFRRSTKA